MFADPRDRIAGFRVLKVLPGIGSKTAERVLEGMDGPEPNHALTNFSVPPRAVNDWRLFMGLLRKLSKANASWPADLENVRVWYEPHLNRIYEDDADARRADLLQLEQIASSYPSRERFLTELTLDPPQGTAGKAGAPMLEEDYLVLSTIHSAKGQEWKAVFVLNAVDGCIPSDLATGTTDEIEEERRLLYVAMTRAKDDLHITVPHRFYTHQQPKNGDRHVYASRTRFIPNSLLTFFDCTEWHAEAAPSSETAAPMSGITVDLGSRVRARWQ